MSDEPPGAPQGPKITRARILIWVVTGAVGLWLIGTGVAGIIAKG